MRKTRLLLVVSAVIAWEAATTAYARTPNVPAPVRTPAEFEPVQSVVLRWYPGFCDGLYASLVDTIQMAGARACVVVENGQEETVVRNCLRILRTRQDRLSFVHTPTNSVWIRDYGAPNLYDAATGGLAFIDCLYKPRERPWDNKATPAIWASFGTSVYSAEGYPNLLAFEGGDFATDGFGTAFTSTLSANINGGTEAIAGRFSRLLATSRCFVLECLPSQPRGHIDMFMKLLDEETILVGEYVKGAAADPAVERNAERLEALTSCYGTPYRIVRIPMTTQTTTQGRRRRVHLLSYTNSLIVNNCVLVPQYGLPYDRTALDVYRDAMPGYRIVGHDCSRIILDDGAIHCITNEVHQEDVVQIAHARFSESIAVGDTVDFYAFCSSQTTVGEVHLHVRMPGERDYTAYRMVQYDGIYSASVPATKAGAAQYFIRARAGRWVGHKPQNAYDGGYLTVRIQ